MMNSGPPTGQPNFMPFRSNFPRQFEAPIRRPPLLQVPLNNVQPIRPSVNDSYPPITTVGVLLFSERQSNNTCLPTGRQPTSLVWILSLVRRIKVVTMSIVIDKFVSLTPHQLFILLRNQHDLNQQTALSLFHLLVKAILQAPVGSNTERLLAYLMDICETELPRSDHTPTVTSIVCTSTASVITNAEGTYYDLQQHNRQQNQPLPHRQQQSKLEYDDFLNSFLLYCREILRVLCETAICLIYSSSETSDLLDHGGCEGFLRAIQQLASRPPPLTLYSTTNVALDRNTSAMSNDKVDLKWMLLSNSKSCLFEKLISSNALQSSSCAQLILSLGMTLEPSLLEHLLFYLCCWKSQTKKINSDTSSFTSPESTRLTASDSPSQQFTYCPLILFFPILSEIQSIWIARTSCKPPSLTATSATSSATVTAGGSTIMPTSITFIHSSIFPVMSVRSKYLSMNSHRNDTSNYNNYSGSGSNNNNTSLSLISPNGLLNSNVELRTSLLRNLLWLVYKEYALIEKNTAHPRILFALAAQLDEIVAMMLKTFDTECLDLLLSLCECIFCSFQFSSSIDDSLNSTNNTDNNACSSSVKLSGPSQHPHPPGRFHQGHQNSGLWKTNIPLLGRHYQTLAFCIYHRHNGSTSSPCRYFYLFGRLRDLLNMLCSSDQLSVFRSTFIRFIPKVMMSGRTHPCMDDLFKNSSAVTDNLNLFTPNISCLPSSFFTNSCPVGKNNTIISSKLVSDSLASSSTFLLLNNPPRKLVKPLMMVLSVDS
ncbi:unnamed protein product [Heterobilharzia americana]|nr:unnamed protein product [Heterobilharzia americana]